MRVFAVTVGRNEADRYLEQMLSNTASFVDEHFFFDDRSDDDTCQIAARYCQTDVRAADVPSFLEHEGRFRQAAWDRFEELCSPREGDWVLAIDCDEFAVAAETPRYAITLTIERAARAEATAALVPIPEVFAVRNGEPWVRVDGFWGTIRGTRLFQYRPAGQFADKAMGCGSEPTYVATARNVPSQVMLLHYGYARPEDQQAKYARYSSQLDHGHNDIHVQSIVKEPVLRRWEGPTVPVSVP